jgi:hypothetical protein
MSLRLWRFLDRYDQSPKPKVVRTIEGTRLRASTVGHRPGKAEKVIATVVFGADKPVLELEAQQPQLIADPAAEPDVPDVDAA